MSTYTPTDAKRTSASEFDDGDEPQATILNPLAEAAFDTATWAANRIPRYLAALLELNDDTSNVLGDNAHSTSFAVPYELYAGTIRALDVVQFQVTFQVGADSASVQVFRLSYSIGFGSIAPLGGSRAEYNALGDLVCVTLTGSLQMGSTNKLHLYIESRSPDGIVDGYFKAPLKMVGQVWRPTA